MKAEHLIVLPLIAGITFNTSAAPKPPPEPQEVNVVNTPSVTVTNPQTSVTVDNTAPIPVNVDNLPNTTTAQLVGFSSLAFNGSTGIFRFTRECQQEFPGGRMCTTQEVASTTTIPTELPPGGAWVNPILVSFGNTQIDKTTGINNASGLNCNFWSPSSGLRGMVVNSNGFFSTQPCETGNYIACCAVK